MEHRRNNKTTEPYKMKKLNLALINLTLTIQKNGDDRVLMCPVNPLPG